MRRRLAVSAGALTAVALLAGCVAIPTSGSVQTAQIDTGSDEAPQIALPEDPQPGQSMADILQGFISAGRAPQNNYSVAKLFLTPEGSTAWSGTERVLISSSVINPVQVDDDTLSITLTVAAEVDATGRYLSSTSTQTLLYDFEVVDGEFRISSAAPGTVLTPGGFTAAFDPYPLYYFDPSFEYLVPDLRWFPRTKSAADRIVTELLAGPAPWLQANAVVSAFPSGTRGRGVLEAPRVDVTLSADVRAESPLTQLRMMQQLRASLIGPLGNVISVDATAGDLSLDLAPEEAPPESRYLVGDLIGGTADGFGELARGGAVNPLTTIGTRANALQPRQASLGRDRASVAVLGPAGVSLVPESGAPIPIDDRAGLIAPTLDPHGYVWTVPAGDPGGLRATGPDGVAHEIQLDVDGQVAAIELARDGARLLVALNTPTGPRLFVAGVVRDADLTPTALGAPFDLPVDGTLVDVAWVDEVHVAVLRSNEAGTTVDVLTLGGPLERLGPVDGGVAIVGGSLRSGLRVLSSSGAVLRPSEAGGWIDTGYVASFLGTQQ